MPKQRVLHQTKIEQDWVDKLKDHATSNGMLLVEVYDDALNEYLAYRQRSLTRGKRLAYLASPTDGALLNVKLTPERAEQIADAASSDNANIRRLLHTAFVWFAEKHKL